MYSLTELHTFGLQASAKELVTIDSIDSLVKLSSRLSNTPYLILGGGSNTIFVEDFEGLVIKNALKGVHISEDDDYFHLNVASGEDWHELVCLCMKRKVYGFENLALIPGTVGASPIQNIGAYGVEIDAFVHSVEFYDVETKMMGYFNNKECEFSYRDSIFKREPGKRVITSVNFALPKANTLNASYGPLSSLESPSPEDVFNQVIATRKSKLPAPEDIGNAGSFFKNPVISAFQFQQMLRQHPMLPHYEAPEGKVKIPAAWLIEQCGFKGMKEGDIACHENQALVLINLGTGKPEDLLRLASKIKSTVFDSFKIELENEVLLVGRRGKVML